MNNTYRRRHFFRAEKVEEHGRQGQKRRPSLQFIGLSISLLFIFLISGVLLFFVFLVQDRHRTSGPLLTSYALTFAPSAAYTQALNTVTNLGLQPGILCNTHSALSGSRQQEQFRVWQPMGQREMFSDTHRLVIVASEYAPTDLQQRLHSNRNVLNIKQIGYAAQPCPSSQVTSTPPTTRTPTPLRGDQATFFIHVAFHPAVTYGEALYQVSNLGLSLSDPCYKQSITNQPMVRFPWDSDPAWHPMSQETTFNKTHVLYVETVPQITSSLWSSQLETIPEIRGVKTEQPSSC